MREPDAAGPAGRGALADCFGAPLGPAPSQRTIRVWSSRPLLRCGPSSSICLACEEGTQELREGGYVLVPVPEFLSSFFLRDSVPECRTLSTYVFQRESGVEPQHA